MIAPGYKFSIVILQAEKMDLLTLLEVFSAFRLTLDSGAVKVTP
jgi:hypothetical protein